MAAKGTKPAPPGEGGQLGDVESQAESFRRARKARRSELVDDYVELIADLIGDGGEARQVDIAARLGVAQPTVAKMLKRLADEGLITQRPYRGVFLTAQGRDLAERSRRRHQIVETFLLAVGVDPEDARRDTEGIEHHVSDATLAVFEHFVKRSGGARSGDVLSGVLARGGSGR